MAKKKILMVYPLPSPVSPQKNSALSVIYPGRAAEDAGYEVEFWEARLDDEKTLWEELLPNADIAAISSLSGFQLGESMRIAKKIRKLFPQIPIIWGGVHVTFQPLQSLRENFVDFVVIGEGEVRFPKLLKAIETGEGFQNIDGIGYKKESVGFEADIKEHAVFEGASAMPFGLQLRPAGKKDVIEIHDPNGCYDGHIMINRRELAVDLKEQYVHVLSPKTKRLFVEAAKRNEIILQSSRGCNWSPTSCEFCSVGGQYTQYDKRTGKTSSIYRHIPFEIWAEDIQAIYNAHPFTFIELEDENSSHFLKDWRYANLLKNLEVQYHLHLRSDQLRNEETIEKLAETGCIRIHIGAESGNQKTLALMRKNELVEDHYIAARNLAKYGVEGVYTWIIGNPGETTEGILDTLRVSDEIKALHPQGKSRATIYVLMPLPGTIAFDRAKREGWPLPEHMEGWTEMSAAYNPKLPNWMNNLYFIAGFHHNRHHKTAQNFPGWWRLFILPFELLIEWRWKMGITRKSHLFFSYFALEQFCINKLLMWRSRHSVGQTQAAQAPKLLERLFPGMAGH